MDFASWITSGLQNFIIITAIASSLIGGLFLWVRDKWKDAKHEREIKGLKKDNEIANSTPKRGSDLIDGL